MQDYISGYSQQLPDEVEIRFFNKKIYVPLTLHIHVIYWYHFYINQIGGSRLANTTRKV